METPSNETRNGSLFANPDIESEAEIATHHREERGFTYEDSRQVTTDNSEVDNFALNGVNNDLVTPERFPTPPTRPVQQIYRRANSTLAKHDHDVSIHDPSVPVLVLKDVDVQKTSTVASLNEQSRFHTPAALGAFDERFTASLSNPSYMRTRAVSPVSISETDGPPSMADLSESDQSHPFDHNTPWEVIRWTRLKNISNEAFSEAGKRNYGRPTCIAVSALIAIGTTKGLVLVFDYHQTLKTSLGPGTDAMECGSVTSLALSADHSTVAAGYSDGSIFTWEIARAGKHFLNVPPVHLTEQQMSGAEGHIQGTCIVHIGFLGTRHTALVSADDKGMAFSHLASRGLGPMSRSVRTTRLLGRYPSSVAADHAKRPSSVLAFAPLPLGNVEASTDSLGLVAMLTPYLLVVVSTTPIAQTQHKASRPKELSPHGALSAAIAWHPSLELVGNQKRNASLAYSWLNVVTILELVEIGNSDESSKSQPPEFEFKTKIRWQASESVVAMQWLNHSVLALVTITQQLLVFETSNSHVTDSSDLLRRQVYHVDLFSNQLSQLVESLDEGNAAMHGVVADAFFMSFRVYKGRMFLLGYSDVSMGTLSNWADRLVALMEDGDFISAIELATIYFSMEGNSASIGLPGDHAARQALVGSRLGEMISASLSYAFGPRPHTQAPHLNESQLKKLARVCFNACLALNRTDLLFEDVFDWFSETGRRQLFYNVLESFIMNGKIHTVPPTVLKMLVSDFVAEKNTKNLEMILCNLNPEPMDLDQITALCKEQHLYDALLYVWSQGLYDYTTVLDMLLKTSESRYGYNYSSKTELRSIFPYLTYTLTSRIYPTGKIMEGMSSVEAKISIYHYVFSNTDDHGSTDPSNLKRLIRIDNSGFFRMLNEAFEDGFLNRPSELGQLYSATNNSSEQWRFSLSLSRQLILEILLKVVTVPDFDNDDLVFLNIFIARNLAKYPQFLLLPGGILQRILLELCDHHYSSLSEDCQLSVEYLLSVYQPPDIPSLVPKLLKAKFFRVVKYIFQMQGQFSLVLQTCLEDVSDPDAIFHCIQDYLGSEVSLNSYERSKMKDLIRQNANVLLQASIVNSARVLERCAPELHADMVEALQTSEEDQFAYLQETLEPAAGDHHPKPHGTQNSSLIEKYVKLLCRFNPQHITDFTKGLDLSNLDLVTILPALEESGAIDAAIILMARTGQHLSAFHKLLSHLQTLGTAMNELLQLTDRFQKFGDAPEAAHILMISLEKYARVGIWLCRRQSRLVVAEGYVSSHWPGSLQQTFANRSESHLLTHESLWLDLIHAVITIASPPFESRIVSCAAPAPVTGQTDENINVVLSQSQTKDTAGLYDRLNSLVRLTFTSLLDCTNNPHVLTNSVSNMSFTKVLRAYLSRISTSSQSLAHLRSILGIVFAAYTYEEEMLGLATRLLDKDLYIRVEEVSKRRKKGWRPLGQVCGECGNKVWGPGVGGFTWDSWLNKASQQREYSLENPLDESYHHVDIPTTAFKPNKGKEKLLIREEYEEIDTKHADCSISSPNEPRITDSRTQGNVVIFSCRHLFHRECLTQFSESDQLKETQKNGKKKKKSGNFILPLKCPLEL